MTLTAWLLCWPIMKDLRNTQYCVVQYSTQQGLVFYHIIIITSLLFSPLRTHTASVICLSVPWPQCSAALRALSVWSIPAVGSSPAPAHAPRAYPSTRTPAQGHHCH